MIIAVTLHNATTRRKRYYLVILLVCISGVFWCGLAALKYKTDVFRGGTQRDIPVTNEDEWMALEHANHRRLQESYPQGEGLPARSTQRRASYEQQSALARATIVHDASFQERTRSLERPQQQLSSAEDIQLLLPPHGGTQQLSPQQQHRFESASQPLSQRFSPEGSTQERESPSQFRSAGSHQLQESFQHKPLHSDVADQEPRSFSGLRHQERTPQLSRLERQVRTVQEDVERPIMYTYYEKAVTDMTDDADASLLENWKKAWFDAGWEPTVINESDARGLFEFDALVALVVDPKHIGTYNMACYIRWIAMAAVGGGFMSDYDTFPLNHFLRHGRNLPFDGELTVWAGHVPALVSGSASEYFRMAKRIGLSIQKHATEQKHINLHGPKDAYRKHLAWSDMLALAEIYKTSEDMFIKKYEVVNGVDVLQVEDWTRAHCSMTNGMRAVHFSHKAMDMGKQAYRGAIHRGTVARQFLNTWHKVCNYTPVADDQPT